MLESVGSCHEVGTACPREEGGLQERAWLLAPGTLRGLGVPSWQAGGGSGNQWDLAQVSCKAAALDSGFQTPLQPEQPLGISTGPRRQQDALGQHLQQLTR